ncbi:very short patch repair endonuclease [Mycolicibacillus trivialis]|uniref:very short patch repair endonuclease n=1 Tax=Mycolicibacillus trivialis TaxID=1798 RepID=UPI0021F3776D|nr:very short patch repair endonuclease [Mycolicibacillus trivialis]
MGRPTRVGAPAVQDLGIHLPTPGRSRNMAAIRRRDTKPEVELRSILHRNGHRFRKDYPVRACGRLIRPDIVFTKHRVAVFVDGCFWHCCPEHGREPSVNIDYWSAKLSGNSERDRLQTAALKAEGWTVLRFWEHDDARAAALIVANAIEQGSKTR